MGDEEKEGRRQAGRKAGREGGREGEDSTYSGNSIQGHTELRNFISRTIVFVPNATFRFKYLSIQANSA